MKIIENGKVLIETERLIIREMVQSDYEALCRILCDEDVMRATYESAFSHEEAQSWLNRHLKRYAEYGFGLWAVVLKEANVMIGQCGLTIQGWREREVLEIGYLFQKAYWHKGYATEAAIACREYAFSVLNASSVYSIVRDTNIASQNVAVRNGMKIIDKDTKNFRSVDMEFFLYSVERASIAIDDVLDVKVVKPFRHETLEERAAEFNGKLNLDGEYDWGESV
ncbi:GNAT family N-acetyltransferase [Anaerosporobacter sp.]|uniref:GNAT family N-acetyltransferase n=1 Tax=Anaerosporobacter sp. TaxID=1872529 RepID=UPI002F40DCE0